MKLQFTHTVSQKRLPENVNQKMVIEVEYDHEQDSFDVLNVDVYEDGKFKCEISKLLHKAEGNPLKYMAEEIPWADIYREMHEEKVLEEDFDIVQPTLFDQVAKLSKDCNAIFYGINVKNGKP